MNLPVKISLGLTIFALLYFIFNYSLGDKGFVVKVKCNDNVTEYVTTSWSEVNDLQLKSKAGCLFFDGQTFFIEAPSKEIRSITKAEILDVYGTPINGDITIEYYVMIIAMIIIAGGGITFMIWVGHVETEYPRDYHY